MEIPPPQTEERTHSYAGKTFFANPPIHSIEERCHLQTSPFCPHFYLSRSVGPFKLDVRLRFGIEFLVRNQSGAAWRCLLVGCSGGDGDWQEFISISSQDELDTLGTVSVETGGIAFQWEDGVLNISDSGGDGSYGLMVVMASGQRQTVTSFALLTTLNELSEARLPMNEEESGTLQVELEEPAGSNDFWVRSYLEDDDEYSTAFPSTLSFEKQPGTYDLIVTRADSYSALPTHLEARRGLSLTAGVTLEQTIASDAFDSSNELSGPYTIRVLNADSSPMTRALYHGDVNLLTLNNTEAELVAANQDDDTDITYTALGGLLNATDIYSLYLNIEPDETSEISYFEGFRNEGDKNVTPPSEPFAGSFDSRTSGGILLPGLTATAYADAVGYTAEYSGTADEVEYSVSAHFSAERSAEYSSATTLSFIMPDFGSTPGWNSRWSIPDTAVMERTVASVQIGEAGITLQDFIDWYLGDKLFLDDGEWLSSIAEVEYGEGTGGNL